MRTAKLSKATVAGLAALLVAIGMYVGGPAKATSNFSFLRLAGNNRFDTARLIATNSFPTSDDVIIASGRNFPAALAANYLAGTLGAPALLTEPTTLPPETT